VLVQFGVRLARTNIEQRMQSDILLLGYLNCLQNKQNKQKQETKHKKQKQNKNKQKNKIKQK
jgi:hypothetical protein